MMAGICLILIGLAVTALQRARIRVPAGFCWLFAAMVAAAVVAMPTSGAWLLVPAAIGLLWHAIGRRDANGMANPEALP